MSAPPSPHAQVVVDLGAIRRNVGRLRELVSTGSTNGGGSTNGDGSTNGNGSTNGGGPAEGSPATPPALMVVVKADGYGHGMVPVARAARAAGADWLGVATGAEALALRAAGDEGRLLCWLATPGADYTGLVAADVDVTASTVGQLAEVVRDARAVGQVARLQLKFDTGLSRGGAARADWADLVRTAREAEVEGSVRVTGVWSHLASSDEPDHPANAAQAKAFEEVCGIVADAGLQPEVRHLANSAGALLHPAMRHDLVRLGIAVYGLSPAPDVVSEDELGLEPAMTVRGSVVLTKQLGAGEGISYGHTFVTEQPMRVALVPMGYGDGIPRHASSRAEVLVGGRRGRVLGRVCMDQFVVEAVSGEAGDEVVLFGPGTRGEPTATDWARWSDTINYEIVTRMGGRQTRVWVGDEAL